MRTIFDPRYAQIIETLIQARKKLGIPQTDLAKSLGQKQSHISKVENSERKLDIIELFDWLEGLNYEPHKFFQDLGWFPLKPNANVIPLPVKGEVKKTAKGVLQQLVWEGQMKDVLLESITPIKYLEVEEYVSNLFESLDSKQKGRKNREAIADALSFAINKMPKLNPSDIYHHIIYRLYLREYNKSTPEQSWVRAGGEALEIFVERRYLEVLKKHNIQIKALLSTRNKRSVLKEMKLSDQVGDSKVDIALYGIHKNQNVIFGGIHCKASLAERVSDDVPCSEAMMKNGLASFLYTFDAKSFPPPTGDLVNRGELGTNEQPSDKRKYIENHGSFDACFSYNLRTVPSPEVTQSGRKILVCSFESGKDLFPEHVIETWTRFKLNL